MSTSKTIPKKARGAYHHGNLRPALIEAALALIERGGPDAVTLRDVAKRAGVSHAAPYRHFADKESLLAAVACEGFKTLERELTAAGEGERDPVRRLRRQGAAYVRFGVRHPAHYAVMFGRGQSSAPDHVHDPELAGAGRAAFEALIETLRLCREAGVLRPEPLEALALSTWAHVHGLTSLLVSGALSGPLGEAPPEETIIALVARITWEGLRA